MSKQISIEWLFAHLVPHLDWSKVEDRKLFRKLKAEAEQMHKEEICKFADDYADQVLGGMNQRANIYYQETYGGNNES